MQMIEVTKLIPHPRNNEFFDDITGDNWNEFKKSIETSGVIEPVIITQDKVIVSGHQRVRACNELNINEVPCEVKIYESDQQVIKDLLETNLRQRGIGNTNSVKFARCIVELEKIYNINHGGNRKSNGDNLNLKTQEELSTELGISQRQLSDYKKLLTLIPELQQLIETDKLSPTIGYKVLSKLSKEEQEKLISDLGKDYISTLTQKKAEELVKNIKPIDNTDYDTIDILKYELLNNKTSIESLKRDKDLLERKVKLNAEEVKKYNDLKNQIESLTSTKDELSHKINAVTSLSALVVDINHLIETKLAPIKYANDLLVMKDEEVFMENLTEIINKVRSWYEEISSYLPNNNMVTVEAIKYE
jgi:ParB-like chromosome segregation protein Spo0J